MLNHLEAMGIEPCFLRLCPLRSRKGFIREDPERISGHGNAWMALDVISFVYKFTLHERRRNTASVKADLRAVEFQTHGSLH